MERTDLSDLLSQIGDDTDVAPVNAALTDPRDLERPTSVESAVIESTGGLEFSPEFASFVSRFLGLIVDNVITALMMLPGVAVVVVGGYGALTALGIILALAGFVTATWLYAHSISTTGMWFGNRMLTTKVIDVSNGAMLTTSNAAARFVIRALISPVFLLGFLIAFGNSQRRTFHDQIASSVVSRPIRETWSAGDNTGAGNS